MPTTNEPTDIPDPSALVLNSFELGTLVTVQRTTGSGGPQTVTGVVTSLHLGNQSFDMTALRPWDQDAPYNDLYHGIDVQIGWDTVQTIRPASIRLLVEINADSLTDREIDTTAARLVRLQHPVSKLELHRRRRRDADPDPDDRFRVRLVQITGLTDQPQEAGQ